MFIIPNSIAKMSTSPHILKLPIDLRHINSLRIVFVYEMYEAD